MCELLGCNGANCDCESGCDQRLERGQGGWASGGEIGWRERIEFRGQECDSNLQRRWCAVSVGRYGRQPACRWTLLPHRHQRQGHQDLWDEVLSQRKQEGKRSGTTHLHSLAVERQTGQSSWCGACGGQRNQQYLQRHLHAWHHVGVGHGGFPHLLWWASEHWPLW